jgi:hypothetical protein
LYILIAKKRSTTSKLNYKYLQIVEEIKYKDKNILKLREHEKRRAAVLQKAHNPSWQEPHLSAN